MAALSHDQKWMLVSTGAAMAAAATARVLLEQGWKRARGAPPPKNPAGRGVGWSDALLWGAGTGVLVGVARVVAERAAAGAWARAQGARPRALR